MSFVEWRGTSTMNPYVSIDQLGFLTSCKEFGSQVNWVLPICDLAKGKGGGYVEELKVAAL